LTPKGSKDAEEGGETREGGGLVDAQGEQVEDGEVACGIDGAGTSAGVGEGAGFEGGFGCAHLVDVAGDHALNGVFAVVEGVFEGLDDLDGVAIGFDPEGDAAVGLLEVFEDELAAAWAVKGEDDCAKGAEEAAELAGNGGLHVVGMDEVAGEGAEDCAVGGDEGHVGGEAEVVEDGDGIGVAAACGDGDGDAGVVRGVDGG
jgi:hypothetical protein